VGPVHIHIRHSKGLIQWLKGPPAIQKTIGPESGVFREILKDPAYCKNLFRVVDQPLNLLAHRIFIREKLLGQLLGNNNGIQILKRIFN